MIGIELPNAEQVDEVLEQMKDRGFLLGKNGVARNVIALQPPLVVTEEDILEFIRHFSDVLASISQ